MAGVAGLIWIALFLYLSVQAGNRRNKGEEESVLTLHWFDAIYTEVYICMGFIAYLAIWILGKTLMNSSLADIYAIGVLLNEMMTGHLPNQEPYVGFFLSFIRKY